MPKEGRVNGHRPTELIGQLGPISISTAPVEDSDFAFDIDRTVTAVTTLRSEIPSDARTAAYLGTEREGSGIVIDDQGLVLTIGYLMLESRSVLVSAADGATVATDFVAYDAETGFGLVRARSSLDRPALPVGSAAELGPGDDVVVAARGGRRQAILSEVSARREFAGYWEYLVEDAIFTAPPHPNWSGAALIDGQGLLCGVGSLLVDDAGHGESASQGNMFVPIDLLPPLLDALDAGTLDSRSPRPWLGMFTAEALEQLVVTHVAPDGPAERAGIKAGDVVIRARGEFVSSLADFYRLVWSMGPAGVDVPLTVLRESVALELVLHSVARGAFFRTPRE